ncbi:DMT family transporter [Muricoccus radiodurans]|uniref:DMT family transporter n=1 Tax=Muricoccus radiodurans TaxID=2231721 RepID=UPI003CFA06F0
MSIDGSSAARGHRRLGLFYLSVTAIGWGLNWPILKSLLTEMPPLAARGYAGVLAALALATFAASRGRPLAVPAGQFGRLVIASLLNVTAWMGLATIGLRYVGAGEGAIICYTMPAWTALMAWPVLGERPTFARILALALGLAGVAILITARGFEVDESKLPGVAIILSGAILFAYGTVAFKRRPLPMNPVAATAWQVGLGCLPLAIASPFLESFSPATLSTAGWAAFLYMAAIPLCLCYLTWFSALAVLPAGVATIGTLATPIIGVLSASAWLGEPFGTRQAIALALTLAGILLAVQSSTRKRRELPQ